MEVDEFVVDDGGGCFVGGMQRLVGRVVLPLLGRSLDLLHYLVFLRLSWLGVVVVSLWRLDFVFEGVEVEAQRRRVVAVPPDCRVVVQLSQGQTGSTSRWPAAQGLMQQ